jgi:hypothetical protein
MAHVGAIIPVKNINYNGKPAKYKVKFLYWWSYAYTLEEAEKLSEQAKSPEFAKASNYY